MIAIKDFEGYYITEDYQVWSEKSNKFLTPQINKDGYATFNLRKGKKDYHRRRCRLMAQAFLPDYSEDLVVNHKDFNKLNDSIDNLEMVTQKENVQHSVLNQPEKHRHRATYNEQEIRSACDLLQQGMYPKEVSELTGMSVHTLRHLRRGKCWSEISKDYVFPKYVKVLTGEMATWVSRQLIKGLLPTQILRLSPYPEVTISSIKSIKSGSTFVKIYQEELAKTFNDQSKDVGFK